MGTRCVKYSDSVLYSHEVLGGKKSSDSSYTNAKSSKRPTHKPSLNQSISIPDEKLAGESRKPIKRTEATTCSKENIRTFYNIDAKKIGNGHFGVVRMATLKTDISKLFAVKTINLSKYREKERVMRELEILKTLDHPNIVKFHETYIEDDYFHIVMEYCSGGELFEKLFREGKLSEGFTRKIMKKIFSAVKYLHDHDICHRDLKPENFLFVDKGKDADIKIIDFGLAKFVSELDSLKTMVGTPLYVAPEILKGKYDKRCDNWSLGVIMYFLLSGIPPFSGHSNEEIFQKVKSSQLKFKSKEWKEISSEAKNLILNLLIKSPEKRYTARDALGHNWFNIKLKGLNVFDEESPLRMDPKIICLLKEYKFTSLFKREVLRVMVNLMKEADIKKMNLAFRKIDCNNTGTISFEKLKKVMDELGLREREEEIRKIITNIEADEKDQINYTDFIAATLDRKYYLKKERLWDVFKYFDVDDSQYITLKNLSTIMARMGRKVPFKDLENMIKEVDTVKDGKISFQEFINFMRDEGPKPPPSVNQEVEISNCEKMKEFRYFRTPPSLEFDEGALELDIPKFEFDKNFHSDFQTDTNNTN